MALFCADTFHVAFPFEEEWEPEVLGGEAELFDLLSTRAFPAHDDLGRDTSESLFLQKL
jgi:hypothetical protein